MTYWIEWNTGDAEWDDFPITEEYDSLKELIDAIHNAGEEIDDEQIERIEKGECVFDYSDEVWSVIKKD